MKSIVFVSADKACCWRKLQTTANTPLQGVLSCSQVKIQYFTLDPDFDFKIFFVA